MRHVPFSPSSYVEFTHRSLVIDVQILQRLGTEEKYGSSYRKKGKIDGVVMVNFAPFFVAPDGEATLESVANHIEHIGKIAGREQYVFPSTLVYNP